MFKNYFTVARKTSLFFLARFGSVYKGFIIFFDCFNHVFYEMFYTVKNFITTPLVLCEMDLYVATLRSIWP